MGVESIKMARDYRDRDGQCQDTAYGARRADQFPGGSQRDLITVADRRHRNYGPPEPVGNAVDLRVRKIEFGIVDGARKDEQTDAEGDEEEAEAFEAGPEGQQEDLEAYRMFGQFEDADQPGDAQEGQRSARLGAGAAHRRHDVYERDVIRQDGGYVDNVS